MNQGSEETLAQKSGIDQEEWQSRKSFIGFSGQDEQMLKRLEPVIGPQADRIVDRFYNNIERYPELKAIISNAGSNIERLKKAQKQYLLELFAGDYGMSYVERRLKIGVMHHVIKLTPRWYLGAYSIYIQAMMPIILKHYRFSSANAEKAIIAVNKIISLDSQLAIDTYINAVMDDLKTVSMSKGEIENQVVTYHDLVAKVTAGDLSETIEVSGDDDLAQLGGRLRECASVYKI